MSSRKWCCTNSSTPTARSTLTLRMCSSRDHPAHRPQSRSIRKTLTNCLSECSNEPERPRRSSSGPTAPSPPSCTSTSRALPDSTAGCWRFPAAQRATTQVDVSKLPCSKSGDGTRWRMKSWATVRSWSTSRGRRPRAEEERVELRWDRRRDCFRGRRPTRSRTQRPLTRRTPVQSSRCSSE